MNQLAFLGAAFFSFVALAACGGESGGSTTSGTGGHGGASGTTSTTGSGGHGGASGTTSTSATTGSGGGTPTTSSTSSTGSGESVPDPNLEGPYPYSELDDVMASVPGGHTNVAVHCAYPTGGPSAGPYPVVVVGHGLQISAEQYQAYVRRLASFGYVAMTVDFKASIFDVDNPKQAKDMLAGIDWAAGNTLLKADPTKAGMTGHSLGGKVALLAATLDPRVKAAIVLDPVDGGGPTGCNAPSCVMVASLMPNLQIPTGFLGETTDATGFQSCAPAATNYTTFYAAANPPSLEVTVTGANHVSFVDDPSACGLSCSLCKTAQAPQTQVHDLALAMVTAFYERHLRGNTGYDTYLHGAVAQERYVSTGQATIVSK